MIIPINKKALFLLLSMGVCALANSQDIRVRLSNDTLPDIPGKFIGISNLAFEPPDSSVHDYPSSGQIMECDKLTTTPLGKAVYIFRKRNTDGQFDYFVDLNGDGKIDPGEGIKFGNRQNYEIGDFKLAVSYDVSARQKRYIPFEIIIADKYVYARINEQKKGYLKLDDKTYLVVARPFSRQSVKYSATGSRIYIDINHDGKINDHWDLNDGRPVASEEVISGDAFSIDGKALMVDSIDKTGEWLFLKPYLSDEGLSMGFKFPAAVFENITGHEMAKISNGYYLIELWSIYCPFCEAVRPKLNTLIGDHARVKWFSMCRENEQIASGFLTSHPMEVSQELSQADEWKYLNPQSVTPMFYLLSSDGTVLIKGAGADMYRIISAVINRP
jgi:hypothetical protein